MLSTPSGGARSVRVELPGGWEDSCPEEAILATIHGALR
jgi:hypothetical protein